MRPRATRVVGLSLRRFPYIGEVVARFEPNIDPMDDAIVDAVGARLPAES